MIKIKKFFLTSILLSIFNLTNLYANNLIDGTEDHYGLGNVSFAASMVLNNIAKLLLYVAIIAGIAFILTSLLKLKQHWKNPQQVSISQVISLFILGVVLVGIPLLINYTQDSTTFSTGFFYNEDNNLQLALN